jgi:lactoylglutathione lyase
LPGDIAYNHIGLCVSDRVRSRQFYENALGFKFWWELEAPDEGVSKLLQLPRPIGLHATYLFRDGLVLELLEYAAIELPPWQARSMAELGLTHLSFSVDDLGEVLKNVRAYGGSVIEESATEGGAIIIRDPDGQLIELLGMGWPGSLPARPVVQESASSTSFVLRRTRPP